MKRFASVFALGLAATLALGGCNAAKDVAETTTEGAVGAVDSATDAAGAASTAADAAATATDAASSATDAAATAVGDAATAVGDAAAGASGGLMAMKDGVTGMTSSITSTVDSVKTGDFAAAKESFSGVETAWGNLKAMVPADVATGIEAKIAEVSTGLAADAPDAAGVTASLGGLTDLVSGLAAN